MLGYEKLLYAGPATCPAGTWSLDAKFVLGGVVEKDLGQEADAVVLEIVYFDKKSNYVII